MSEKTDSTLLLGFVRDGDEEAFAALLKRHREMIYHAAYNVLHDWTLSEDVVQMTFEILASKAKEIVWRVGSLGGWLHSVALDCARDLRKSESCRQVREQEAAMHNQSQRRETDLDGIMLHEAVKRLPEIYRQPLVMHYFEGYRQAEAASMLGITRVAFAVRCVRARETLRAWLHQSNPARSCT